MPKIPPKSFISKTDNEQIPNLPIPPFPIPMPSLANTGSLPPLPPLPPPPLFDKNNNMFQKFQEFHHTHFLSSSFPIGMFMPYPFHPPHPSTEFHQHQEPTEYGYSYDNNEYGEETEGYEEVYEEDYQEDENEEEELMSDDDDDDGNNNKLSFNLSKETIEMFRFSELYRQKLKEEKELEEKRRLEKEKEEELRQLKIYQEHNKNYEEHMDTYGGFKLKLLEDHLNEEFKKNNTEELWPILPLNE